MFSVPGVGDGGGCDAGSASLTVDIILLPKTRAGVTVRCISEDTGVGEESAKSWGSIK
jgi:hypothetical protein